MTTAALDFSTPEALGFNPERFPAWRAGQEDVVQQILRWYRGPKKYLFLEAPTGVGKSIIAGAVLQALRKEQGDQAEFWGIVTTTTINLQKQYMEETLAGLADSAWGRGNHECLIMPDGTPVSEAPCVHGFNCEFKRSDCTYYKERDDAHFSHLAVLNTAFYLNCVNYASIKEDSYLDTPIRKPRSLFDRANLVIHDEAHLLEKAVMSMAEVKLSQRFFDDVGHTLPHVSEYGTWEEWIEDAYPETEALAKAYRYAARQAAASGTLPNDPLGKRAVTQLGYLEQLSQRVLPTRPLIEHDRFGVNFRPIWGKDFAQGLLFRHADKHLLMSATIIHPGYLAETLGIPEGEYEYIGMPSPFQPMRRRIIYSPVRKVNGKTTPQEFQELVDVMDQKIQESHTEQKGIIHSVSYARAEQIVSSSEHRARMVTHGRGRGEKELAISRFLAAEPGAILISPAVGVGEDFGRGDNCRFQFFLKYPYPYLGDPVIKARMEDNPDSLSFEADMAFVQAVGRGMRSSSDYCTSYVLDSSAGRRFKQLPRWVQDSVVDQSQKKI